MVLTDYQSLFFFHITEEREGVISGDHWFKCRYQERHQEKLWIKYILNGLI